MSETDTHLPIDPIMARSRALRTLTILCRIASMIVARFWKMCASASLILILIYWFNGGIFTLVFLVVALFGIFYYAQDMFLYYPEQPPNSRLYVELPDKLRIPYENIFITTSDKVKINGILLKHSAAGAPTIMVLHGNAGNIGHRLMIAYFLYMSCQSHVFLLEYRGYGKSGGSPSESGLYLDAEAGLNFLKQRAEVSPDRIFVMGCSLGGAVSVKLASNARYHDNIAGLILENTFTSLPEIARNLFSLRVLDFLPEICYRNKFPSEYRIGHITIPTLFISGLNDELIPPRMMNTLYNLSGSKKKRLAPFEGGTHNETSMCQGYYETIAQFINEVISVQTTSTATESTIQVEKEHSNSNIKLI